MSFACHLHVWGTEFRVDLVPAPNLVPVPGGVEGPLEKGLVGLDVGPNSGPGQDRWAAGESSWVHGHLFWLRREKGGEVA